MNDLFQRAHSLFDYTRALRRDFHRHPELGYQEVRTAGIVSGELRSLGMEVTSGIAGTGVVGLLEGAQPGPVIMLRFDMDALPIDEQTGAEYASEHPGVMHACGHDGHVAVGLTVARLLAQMRAGLKGSVKFVFQPAEEGLGGAEKMIEAGMLENPRASRSLALHLWNEKPIGWVGVTAGPLMAGADIFHAVIEGKGGHGALPHASVDPVVAAAHVVTALQSIVSRNVSPLDTAVVSVCKLQAGDAFNVIPQRAELSGTIRTYDRSVREKVVERLQAVVNGVSQSLGCAADLRVNQLTPAVVNDPGTAAVVRQSAIDTLSNIHLVEDFRTMVSEDMAFFMEKVPGCYIMVGSANAERGLNFGHHHPCFDFDEEAMPGAAALMAAAAIDLLRQP